MDDTTSFVWEILVALIALSVGLYTFWRGWKLSRLPTETAPPATYRLAIWLSGIIQDERAAMRREAQLMEPRRLKRSGHYALAVSICLIVIGILQVVGLFLKILRQ